jgi:uncharacterized membrane protein
MENKIAFSRNQDEETRKALEALEAHKKKDDATHGCLAITMSGLSLAGCVLFIYTRDDRLIVTPLLPIIFGIVGIVKSKTSKGTILSIVSLVIGIIEILLLIILPINIFQS